jgi:hypothetical protein
MRRHPREKLLETFYTKIASRSTVPMADAEARIAAFEATLFDKRETPGATDTPGVRRPSSHTTSIDDFFATLRRARGQETDE